jgi:hypothetical protein
MDIIPIQATSVPCERAFSSGKETMAPRRRRIAPDLMEALQILKYSIRKVNFTEGMSWSDEMKEFEYMARTAPSEDADTYGRNLNQAEQDDIELENIVEATVALLEADIGSDEESNSDTSDNSSSSPSTIGYYDDN